MHIISKSSLTSFLKGFQQYFATAEVGQWLPVCRDYTLMHACLYEYSPSRIWLERDNAEARSNSERRIALINKRQTGEEKKKSRFGIANRRTNVHTFSHVYQVLWPLPKFSHRTKYSIVFVVLFIRFASIDSTSKTASQLSSFFICGLLSMYALWEMKTNKNTHSRTQIQT